MASFNQERRAAAPQREEEQASAGGESNKYGGISAKKPLINKDHQRAYFDSADWVLGKQQGGSGGSTTAAGGGGQPLLKPKLQRTAYHQLPPRRPACTSE